MSQILREYSNLGQDTQEPCWVVLRVPQRGIRTLRGYICNPKGLVQASEETLFVHLSVSLGVTHMRMIVSI